MTSCTVRYTVDGSERRCPRPVAADHDRCVFHLAPEERAAADITSSTLRTAFLADVDADDPARREYVDINLSGLDLSAFVVDGSDVGRITFCDVTVDGTLDLSEAAFDLLRVRPGSDLTCRLQDATVSEGRLDQPEEAVACYDLTDATLGDVDLDCAPATFDRYRFYRTRFDGFPFASYRAVLRANRWRLHEYVGTPAESISTEGLEHTYLEAKQGATGTGDSETASMFFVRELRYRRQRYADHARAADHSLTHRVDAALRWATNGFLDLIAGYGERPQRTLALALAVIVGSALAYPADSSWARRWCTTAVTGYSPCWMGSISAS